MADKDIRKSIYSYHTGSKALQINTNLNHQVEEFKSLRRITESAIVFEPGFLSILALCVEIRPMTQVNAKPFQACNILQNQSYANFKRTRKLCIDSYDKRYKVVNTF